MYARALTERNVPVSTTGAALTQEHELRELLVVLRATDDASQQHLHARSSYKAAELVWNARFQPIHSKDSAGHLRVDVARLSRIEPVPVAPKAPESSKDSGTISEPV